MKKIISIATVAGLILGMAGASLAANSRQGLNPTDYQLQKLEVVRALEQKEASTMQRPATSVYGEQETVIDNILNRLYRGDPVSSQELDRALQR